MYCVVDKNNKPLILVNACESDTYTLELYDMRKAELGFYYVKHNGVLRTPYRLPSKERWYMILDAYDPILANTFYDFWYGCKTTPLLSDELQEYGIKRLVIKRWEEVEKTLRNRHESTPCSLAGFRG